MSISSPRSLSISPTADPPSRSGTHGSSHPRQKPRPVYEIVGAARQDVGRRCPVAGKIRDEDIALVRERTAIADVISEHVTLKSAGGGNLKGLCPFHDEKTASFNVSPARNVYFSQGCGAGGDAIKFLMDCDHMTFVESVERLAARA